LSATALGEHRAQSDPYYARGAAGGSTGDRHAAALVS